METTDEMGLDVASAALAEFGDVLTKILGAADVFFPKLWHLPPIKLC